MPRLQIETYVQPDDLLLQTGCPVEESSQWWVMHTKARVEKTLARRLCEQNRSFFLPLFQNRMIRRGRVQTSYLPLFPGYLFVYGTEDDRLQTLKTNLVVQCLDVLDQAQLYQDLHNVYRLMESGDALSPESRLEPGRPVEVVHGPLRGMEGHVIRRQNKLRFLVEIRLLQRGVSVEMESWMLSPTDTCSFMTATPN